MFAGGPFSTARMYQRMMWPNQYWEHVPHLTAPSLPAYFNMIG